MPSTGCQVAADYHMLQCIITCLWLYLQTEWVLKDLFFLHVDVCILCWPRFCGIKGSKLHRCCLCSGKVNTMLLQWTTFNLYYICIIRDQIIEGVSYISGYESWMNRWYILFYFLHKSLFRLLSVFFMLKLWSKAFSIVCFHLQTQLL